MQFIKWAVINLSILGSFLYGNIYEVSWAFNIGYFVLWATAVIGTILAFVPEDKLKELVKPKDTFPYKKQIDLAFDVITLLTIVSFGYFVLAIFYLISIAVSQKLIALREELIKQKGN